MVWCIVPLRKSRFSGSYETEKRGCNKKTCNFDGQASLGSQEYLGSDAPLSGDSMTQSSQNLNSLKGGYIGDYIGDYYRAY